MRAALLESYSHLQSPLHRLPAGVKAAGALLHIIGIVLLPLAAFTAMAGVAVLLVALLVLSRLPASFVVKRLLLLEPFVLGVVLLALVQPDGARIAAAMFIKSNLCLLTMVLLSNTTRFTELIRVLQQARVPEPLVSTMALMYRYLFVLTEEASRMSRARASRTFVKGRGQLWRSASTVVGQLFLRSLDRAERIYLAMCARGWK